MADKRISNLPTGTDLLGSDILPINNGGITKYYSAEEVLMVQSLTKVRCQFPL